MEEIYGAENSISGGWHQTHEIILRLNDIFLKTTYLLTIFTLLLDNPLSSKCWSLNLTVFYFTASVGFQDHLDSSSRYARLDLQVLRLAWLHNSGPSDYSLYSFSIRDLRRRFLNGVRSVLSYPGFLSLKTMNHSSMLRFSAALGLSTGSVRFISGLAVIHQQNWLHQTLLASHVNSFIAITYCSELHA